MHMVVSVGFQDHVQIVASYKILAIQVYYTLAQQQIELLRVQKILTPVEYHKFHKKFATPQIRFLELKSSTTSER